MTETTTKRKKTPTKETLTSRIKSVEGGILGLASHVDSLQDQQLVQHVELTALKQMLVEGRPITPESFNKRCSAIYASLAEKVEAEEVTEDEPVSEAEPTGSESATEAVVE